MGTSVKIAEHVYSCPGDQGLQTIGPLQSHDIVQLRLSTRHIWSQYIIVKLVAMATVLSMHGAVRVLLMWL